MPSRRRSLSLFSGLGIALALLFSAVGMSRTAGATPTVSTQTATAAAPNELPIAKAVVLGIVEGVTEFLPISSTGHLLVAERLLDVGTGGQDSKDAADAYTVIIQLGAIAAVLLISWKRVRDVILGVVGKSDEGRRLLIALICAFAPAAVVGLALNDAIDKRLLKPVPVAIAWMAGAVAILVLGRRYRNAAASGHALVTITPKQAVLIGVAQSLALWPGVSRSLVTILAAILLGFSLTAAVEFSFLLGLCTLGAASLFSLAKDGSLVFDQYGTTAPIVGLVVAFVAAAVSVKWMVAYLQRRDLSVFAAYRALAAVATLILVVTNVI